MFKIFPSQIKVYIEITDQQLAIGTLKKTSRNYLLEKIQYVALEKLEVINGVIFNQTSLFSLIERELSKLMIKKSCRAIISLPRINNQSNYYPDHGRALQAALCVAKAGLSVERIINESLTANTSSSVTQKSLRQLPNLLQPYLQKQTTSFLGAIIASIIFLSTAGWYCSQKTKKTRIHNEQLKTEITTLKQKQETVTISQETINTLQSNITTYESAIHSLEALIKTNPPCAPILKIIAEHIPSEVVLTSLRIGRKKDLTSKKQTSSKTSKKDRSKQKNAPKPSLQPLIIKGIAPRADLVVSFNRSLGNNPLLKKARITTLTRNTFLNKKQLPINDEIPGSDYAFTIRAKIASS